MKKLVVIVFFILVLFVTGFAETVTFTGGILTRSGWNHAQPTGSNKVYDFNFVGINTDVNGGLYGSTGLNNTENNSNCCFYGKRLVLADFVEGLNNFLQISGTPVLVNGTSYDPFYYRGTIRFTGAVLVPRYLKKKQTQQLKFPITSTGYIKGYVTLADRSADTPLFFTQLNMTGVATITIASHENFAANHFDIISVRYDLVVP